MEEIRIEELSNYIFNRVSILTYIGEEDPVKKLDDKIKEYTNGREYTEFVDINMDNPWVRVIIFSGNLI